MRADKSSRKGGKNMYRFEKKIEAAKELGIRLSEGQLTYVQCARINGIDVLDYLYELFVKDYANHTHDKNSSDYLLFIGLILTLSEFFDDNMCELIDGMIEQNAVKKAGK